MTDDHRQFERRKEDHIKLSLMPENQTQDLGAYEQIALVHEAIPDINFNEIDISTQRFGKVQAKPFIVSSMTAGHQQAKFINRHLVEACALSGWGMGVGSQRRELLDPAAAFEWTDLRRDFPKVSLYSNLGIAQVIITPLDDIRRLTDALNAEALIIHCNPLQESIQPEGTTEYKGSWHALEILAKNIRLPIIIKETGCGFSRETLERLKNIGISAVDIAGLGGTHWGRIEGHRAVHDPIRFTTASTFKNWGIPTPLAVREAAHLHPNYEIWGSGGVQNGLNAAKLFALGASTVGFAKPILEPALVSAEQVVEKMLIIEYELRVAMFCTGSAVLTDLRQKVAA
ncbi:MAG: type 2 isopentenyl-diphosphate Delta-isomerase [Legionella sp. 40-6]|nr:type 2 isopentenyl-diphosphate Delta-isomerase [Legionella sp.]OJX92115.1 MAG: type 2 isopentenyl-diphosphate Delta-isomerase [Legionella sp. 40-6]